MESWAKQIPSAQFLCVCVESAQVAMAFHSMFQLDHVVNCYIPGRNYMPVGYGQLGCSGFIISDGFGCFVSRKTKRFLDYGEEAFRHVEDILRPMLLSASAVESSSVVEEKKQEEKEQKNDEIIVNGRVRLPPSVGVDTMDDEHKECTDSFNKLLQNPTPANMKQLYQILQEHFQHEEDLLQEYSNNNNNNNTTKEECSESKASEECDSCACSKPPASTDTAPPSSFSSTNSHKLDHERILRMAEAELSRSSASCTSSNGG